MKTGKPGPADAGAGRYHLFVHTIRFWSMAGVIAMHTLPLAAMTPSPRGLWFELLLQPFKFGSIGFFLIAGFLLGDRLQTARPVDYFRRRVASLLPPWLAWIGVTIGYQLASDVVHDRTAFVPTAMVQDVLHLGIDYLHATSFWFVPNLLFSIACLLLCRRWLRDVRLGAVLLVGPLFYAVNTWTQWVSSRHTDALFGFIFYLWLGAYLAPSIDRLRAWIDRVPLHAHLAAIAALCAVAMLETRMLRGCGALATTSTLRLSNQLFSVVVVAALLRLRRPTWPAFLQPSRQTFGIHLAHPLCMLALTFVLRRTMPAHPALPLVLAAWPVLFAATYASALALTNACLAWAPLAWLVAGKAAAQQPQAPRQRAAALHWPTPSAPRSLASRH